MLEHIDHYACQYGIRKHIYVTNIDMLACMFTQV